MKPTSTSAGSTAFCSARVDGPSGHLWIDGNGITRDNGTLENPKPNAFSLVQIADCPEATELCKASCYVHNLEKYAPETHLLYRHNSVTIRKIVDNPFLASQWVTPMARWITENCRGGFRWHVSGDIFSAAYADWIAAVCFSSPAVSHWLYTRSFSFVDRLMPASTTNGKNLAINLSVDAENWGRAITTHVKHHLRLCYLTLDGQVPGTLPDGSVIFPDYSLRGGTDEGHAWFAGLQPNYKSFVCPVDYHGKSEVRRCGPCARCLI